MGGEGNTSHPPHASQAPLKATRRERSGITSGDMSDSAADPLLDLRALTRYSTLSLRTLARHLRDLEHPLPHYKVWGKILVRRSEFDRWMEGFRRHPPPDVPRVVDEVMAKFRR
jgi:hypothetical protein